MEGHSVACQRLRDNGSGLRILLRENAFGTFDDGHRRPEGGEGLSELTRDAAATEDGEPFGQGGEPPH